MLWTWIAIIAFTLSFLVYIKNRAACKKRQKAYIFFASLNIIGAMEFADIAVKALSVAEPGGIAWHVLRFIIMGVLHWGSVIILDGKVEEKPA